jgi:hypothetical protein
MVFEQTQSAGDRDNRRRTVWTSRKTPPAGVLRRFDDRQWRLDVMRTRLLIYLQKMRDMTDVYTQLYKSSRTGIFMIMAATRLESGI